MGARRLKARGLGADGWRMPSLPVQFGLIALWLPVLVLVHELGHAVAALALTRGPVIAVVGRGRNGPSLAAGRLGVMFAGWGFTGGYCAYRVPTRRRQAAIAAAGPATSLLAGAALLAASVSTSHPGHGISNVWLTGAVSSLLAAVVNLVPATASAGQVTDGAHVYRGLTGRDARGVANPPKKPIRWPFAVVLAAVAIFTLIAMPMTGMALLAIFGLAFARTARR